MRPTRPGGCASTATEPVGLLAAREDMLAAMACVFVQSSFRGQRARLRNAVQGGAVVFVQRFTKTLTVYPHLHVLALDGGYTEAEDGELQPSHAGGGLCRVRPGCYPCCRPRVGGQQEAVNGLTFRIALRRRRR